MYNEIDFHVLEIEFGLTNSFETLCKLIKYGQNLNSDLTYYFNIWFKMFVEKIECDYFCAYDDIKESIKVFKKDVYKYECIEIVETTTDEYTPTLKKKYNKLFEYISTEQYSKCSIESPVSIRSYKTTEDYTNKQDNYIFINNKKYNIRLFYTIRDSDLLDLLDNKELQYKVNEIGYIDYPSASIEISSNEDFLKFKETNILKHTYFIGILLLQSLFTDYYYTTEKLKNICDLDLLMLQIKHKSL